MFNMDLEHTDAVIFYENNLIKVLDKIKNNISGLDRIFYIECIQKFLYDQNSSHSLRYLYKNEH